MTTKIQYTDALSKAAVISEQEGLGLILVGEDNLFNGNFLVFESPDVLIQQEATKAFLSDPMTMLLDHENRIRALEGQDAVTSMSSKILAERSASLKGTKI